MIACLIGAEAVAEAGFIAAILARAFDDPAQRWSAESVAATLSVPGTVAFLSAQGCALLRIIADEAEILTIARDPAARGRGVGARLLDACITEAGAQGARQLYLEVAAGNAAAIRLYQSHGFTCDGQRIGYYAAKSRAEDALLMSCRTASAA